MTNFFMGLAVGIAVSWFVIKELSPWLDGRRKAKHRHHIFVVNHLKRPEEEWEEYLT